MKKFEHELAALKDKVLLMGGVAEAMLAGGAEALGPRR